MRKRTLAKVITFLLLLTSVVTFAQNITVKGRVIDESGNPVVGATVTVRGTNAATSTNDNGAYTISAKTGATLRFTYVGLATIDQEVTGTDINVTLAKEAKSLNEVVVTALGIRRERKALGYAVSEVKGDELTQARTPNVANALVGKVAGLNIAGTATGPGGSTRITIRGNGSIGSNNQPLIVVDGIPLNNDNLGSAGMWGGSDKGQGISSLNPDEIETMSVLKGGTAAALYGSRASNGAILVTTKGGGKARGIGIDINSNVQVDDLLYKNFKDYQYEYGVGQRGLKPTTGVPQGQTDSWGAKLDGSLTPQFDGVSRPYVAVKDNFSKFYNLGTTVSNSIALSGSSEKVSYRFSFSDMNVHGIVPQNTLKRDNFALNLNATLNKTFSFLTNIKYIKEKNHNRPRLSDSPGNANYSMFTLPTSLDVNTLKESKYLPNRYERVYTDNQYVTNPWFAAEDFIQNDNRDRILASVEPRANITDWLYVRGRFGFDYFNFRNTEIIPTGVGYLPGGQYNTNLRNFTETNMDLMLGINKKISTDVGFNMVAGGNLMKQVRNNDDYGGLGNNGPFNIPFFYDISNTNASNVQTRYNYIEQRINSLYASADFSYKNFAFLTFTGRNDWFSTLAPGRNSIFYPSVSGSFVLSDAFHMPAAFNYAKLRASWAQVGGGADPYQLSLYYGLTGAQLGVPLAGIAGSRVPNALLQPNVQTSYEVGWESRMFNSRFGIDVAVYNRTTTNDIVPASISNASGYTEALFNVGKISNKGVEALISYRVGNPKGFVWEPSFNMGYNVSKVISLSGSLTQLQAGEPARSQQAYAFQVVGQPFSTLQVNSFARDASGNVIYDAQGLPKSVGLKSMGSGVSPFQGGITNSFRYKGVGLSFLIDAKFGGYIYSGTNGLAYRYGLHKETLAGREGGVVGKGVTEDGKANTVSSPAYVYYPYLYNNFGEPFVYKSDFIKLRQVIIDYTIPTKVFGRTPFKGATISVVGRNLLILMKHVPIIDPESNYNSGNAQGLEFTGMPSTRSLGVNLSLRF